MKRALVLVEGPTEDAFIKQVLQPHFLSIGLSLTPTIIATKRILSGGAFKGGVTSFSQFERDIRRLLHGAGGALVTTLIDYYRLPNGFPGMENRPTKSPKERVKHVEQSITGHFGSPKFFRPYLSLHEFEALVFSDCEITATTLGDPGSAKKLKEIVDRHGSPEYINEKPDQNPASRLQKLFPAYQKRLHGPIISSRIGVTSLRSACEHFGGWISSLEAFAINS
jgi:Domain of unknown function (DUF4276)